MMIILAATALALALFYLIVFQLDIPGAWKFFLVAAEMLAYNQLLIKKYGLPSELGLILLKSRKGIEIIDSLARREKVFNFMADVGTTISFGLMSVFLTRKNASLPTVALGLLALALLAGVVSPVALAFLLTAVKGMTIEGSVSRMAGGEPDVMGVLLLVAMAVGGLFLLILSAIVMYGLVVFKAIVTTLFFGVDEIAGTSAGGTILLPGVNLPLLEGIAALVVVLIVHEGAHAILARIAKVPILSSGIVLFGIIPIGAFVEPDEKKLAKVEQGRQTRVLVAGPTANLLTALGFFVLFMAFFTLTEGLRDEGLLVTSGMEPGILVYAIDGQYPDLHDFKPFDLPKNSEVTLLTDRGEITRATNEDGKIGVTFNIIRKDTIQAVYTSPILQSLHLILGLCLALNFVVGAVNILPIPLFDGYRMVDVNVKNKMIVNAISYGALFFFILNFLPLLFH